MYTHKDQKVEEERWGWGVIYKDDTELHQFNRDTKEFTQFAEIDMPNVKLFTLYEMNGKGRVDLPVSEDMQVFYFYRNVKPYYSDSFKRVYVVGFKKDGVACHYFVLPDNRVILTPHLDIDLVKFNV